MPEPTRQARRKDETRRRVLEAAAACFVKQGFDATTMREIAERADVARATVFNHFPDKRSLLIAYLDRRRARVAELLQTRHERGGDTAQTLVDVFGLLADENERDRAETREFAHAWRRSGGSSESSEGLFAAIVTAGQERGELRRDLDSQLAGRLLFDAYVGVVMRWVVNDPPSFALKPMLLEVATTILDGLRD